MDGVSEVPCGVKQIQSYKYGEYEALHIAIVPRTVTRIESTVSVEFLLKHVVLDEGLEVIKERPFGDTQITTL